MYKHQKNKNNINLLNISTYFKQTFPSKLIVCDTFISPDLNLNKKYYSLNP